MSFNAFMTIKAVRNRETVMSLIDMVGQKYLSADLFEIRKLTKETMDLGWKGSLEKMAQVLKDKGLKAVLLKAWNMPEYSIAIDPTALIRYSDGRLTPRDLFGQAIWGIMQMMTQEPPKDLDQKNAANRAFIKARTALESFSLDLAAKSGKTAREYPVFTLRMLDWIEPSNAHIHPSTLQIVGLKPGQRIAGMRDPLPTRGFLTIIADARIPEGCICLNPVMAQMAMSADADGDQVKVSIEWDNALPNPKVGPMTALNAVDGKAGTALKSFLDVKPLWKKLGYEKMLEMPVKEYTDTLYKLAEYSVTGIGQVGYGPALAMATLALLGQKDFSVMAATGFRRMYEDMMLAGMTEDRWDLFLVARDLTSTEEEPNLNEALTKRFHKVGLMFTPTQVQQFITARLLVRAVAQTERHGEPSKKVLRMLGKHARFINIYGLVRTVDAGRLSSMFLKRWKAIIADFDQELPIIKTLKEVCPVMLAARKQTEENRQAKEMREAAMV